MPRHHSPGLPSREKILDFIANADQPAGKREIARAFALPGADKIALKALLKDMADEGLIDASPGRAFHKAGGVPKVTVLRVVDADDGGVYAVPERWEPEAGPPPRLRVMEPRGKRTALGPGDRILARTEEAGRGLVAHPMKTLARGEALVLGVLHDEGGKLWLKPVDKRERRDLPVSDAAGAAAGDLVLAEKTGRPPRITGRVTERLGDPFQPRSFSLIAIHKFGIPDAMPQEALDEAERMAKQPLGEREDLRHLPIVAIDPADARDHDDAVWAAPDDDPANPGGFRAIVAIADVSFYVRPGSRLDREARKRGNSVYFPDRVVPMLPEILSADICSLKEGEDRAALACHLVIGAEGQLRSWRFTRAKVRLAANIAYEDAQRMIDALGPGASTALSTNGEGAATEESFVLSLSKDVQQALPNLWACWAALAKARADREPLDLDLPERRVQIDETGRIASVAPRERLDAHRLIEDFMIAANVAAAKALEAKKAPVMYRDHEPPSREKLVALKDYLKSYDVSFALGQVVKPATFNRLLVQVNDPAAREQVMEQVLRSQTQAYYAPANTGHFGLSLGSYAHFTSPIRRYADLLVHRSLVGSYRLDPDAKETALAASDAEQMERVGELISAAERRAMEAERETVDRYVAAYLSTKVGELVETRITGVRSFGFFATVAEIGGDGLVPVSTLGREYFRYDEASQSLEGEESGTRFTMGQRLQLQLAEANPISGSLLFTLPDTDRSMPPPRRGRTIRHGGKRPRR